MAKKFKSTRVFLQPDPFYRDKLVSQFINCIMWEGKKSVAQRIFHDALQILRKEFAKEFATPEAKKPEEVAKDVKEVKEPAKDSKETKDSKDSKDSKTTAAREEQYELKIFKTALGNVKPIIEVRSRRVGGATYQVPMEVEKKRQTTLAFRWIIGAARARKGKPMAEKLAAELSDAYKKQGKAISQRENTHKMAEANKAFAHFAW